MKPAESEHELCAGGNGKITPMHHPTIRPMKLQTRFSLVIFVIFLIGWLLSGVAVYTVEQQNARNNTVQMAKVLINTASAALSYTSEEIQPLLFDQLNTGDRFLPQSIPSYAAQQLFARLDKDYASYTYSERALNPTNLNDLAEGWQVELIQAFIKNPQLPQLIGERVPLDGEKFLYVAQPIIVNSQSCLQCHSTPDKAPISQIKTYGANHGFGWKLNEIIGTRIISVPTSRLQQQAHHSISSYGLLIASIFLIAYTSVTWLVRNWVIHPLNQIAGLVEHISLQKAEVAQLPVERSDELGTLNRSINRLLASLKSALSK